MIRDSGWFGPGERPTKFFKVTEGHILNNLRDRELGKRHPTIFVRAQTQFNHLTLLVAADLHEYDCRQSSRKKHSRLKQLPQNFFGNRASGFLGVSHDGRYLIAVKARLREIMLMFFHLSPEKAILEQVMRLDTEGLMWDIRTHFPPTGSRFIASYVVDKGELTQIDPTKPSNLPVSIYLVSPEHTFQIRVSTIILLVPRTNPKTKEKLFKYNVRCHSHGLILNTGISLMSLMLVDGPLEEATDRECWYICGRTVGSRESASVITKLNLDLGEEIAVTYTSGTLFDNEDFSKYTLSDVKRGRPDLENPTIHVLPLQFSRQMFSLESILWRTMESYLRKTQQFRGCILRALRDYEADVGEIENGVAPVVALALCEIEMFVDDGQSTNEFHLFTLNFSWDLFEGSYKCTGMVWNRKISHNDAFHNQWWPLERFPVSITRQHFFLDNRYVLLGMYTRTLCTSDGSWNIKDSTKNINMKAAQVVGPSLRRALFPYGDSDDDDDK